MATPKALDGDKLGLEVAAYLAALHSSLEKSELEKARRSWLAEDAFGSDDLEDWSLEIAGRVMLLPWDKIWSAEERVHGVTLTDLKRVALEYLTPDACVYVTLHGSGEEASGGTEGL